MGSAEYEQHIHHHLLPLTKVTIGEADFLQAIVPADNEGDYTLTGFKAVMNVTDPSGATIATH